MLRSQTLLLVAAALAAQDSATAPVTVTVTADRPALTSRTPAQAAAELASEPGGVAVVDGEAIQRGRTATWRDLLQTTPGVVVQPRFGAEEARLSIRGSGVQRTFHLRGIALLQDGIPTNQADGGGDFQAMDPAFADRVEVYRGGNALPLGVATLGGAIDTVSPTGLTGAGVRLRTEIGSFGTFKNTVAAGGARGDVDAWVGASAGTTDGYRDHSAQTNVRVQANVGWRISDTAENRLYLGYAESDSELPGSLTAAEMEDDPTQADPNAVNRDITRDYPLYRIADRLAFAWGARRLEIGAGYTRKELDHPIQFLPVGFGFTGGPYIRQDSDDLAGTVRLVDDTPLAGRGNRFVIGLRGLWGRTDATQNGYAGATGHQIGALYSDALQTATEVAAYGEIQHEAWSNWWLIAGLQAFTAGRDYEDRFLSNGDQSDDKTWSGVNPRIGVRWDAVRRDDALVQGFANLTRSAEPPSFAEYVQGITPDVQEDMEAQTAWTLEVGSRGRLERIAWDVTPYYAVVEDELLQYQVAPGQNLTINAERTIHAGVEAGLDIVVGTGLAAERDRLVLAQVWNWGRFRFDGDDTYGDNQLPGLPEHTWRAELRWELDAWYAGPVVEWQDGWPVNVQNTIEADGSFLVGARAGYRGERGFSAFIEGRNLTDETYAATTGVSNSTAANQRIFNPGDGLAVTVGGEWRH